MPDEAPFVAWFASYTTESRAEDHRRLGRGGPEDPSDPPPDAPSLTEASFRGPPGGDWVVHVTIYFPDGIGDASYKWRAVVR